MGSHQSLAFRWYSEVAVAELQCVEIRQHRPSCPFSVPAVEQYQIEAIVVVQNMEVGVARHF